MKTRVVQAYDEEYIFARNLKMLRQKQKPFLSQRRLAERLGVCRSTYASYEAGTRQAPAFFIVNAAGYFGVSADKMLREKMWKE